MDRAVKFLGCLMGVFAVLGGCAALAVPNEAQKELAPIILTGGILCFIAAYFYDYNLVFRIFLRLIVGGTIIVAIASNIYRKYLV